MAEGSSQAAQSIKILVPINFSFKSDLAIDFALNYSQSTDAQIFLFYVAENAKKLNYRELDKLNEELVDKMEKVMIEAIERADERHINHSVVGKIHRRLAHGKVGKEILDMTEGINADLVVMGFPTSKALTKATAQFKCSVALTKAKELL